MGNSSANGPSFDFCAVRYLTNGALDMAFWSHNAVCRSRSSFVVEAYVVRLTTNSNLRPRPVRSAPRGHGRVDNQRMLQAPTARPPLSASSLRRNALPCSPPRHFERHARLRGVHEGGNVQRLGVFKFRGGYNAINSAHTSSRPHRPSRDRRIGYRGRCW